MLDGLRGTEQEYNKHYCILCRMCLRPEQARDIAVVVSIKTIGGDCQDLGKCLRGGIKISSKCTRPPLGGLGHETRVSGAHRCERQVNIRRVNKQEVRRNAHS